MDGEFRYWPGAIGGKAYIRIDNTPGARSNHSQQLGTVLHELGHFTQYGMKGGFSGYDGTRALLRESWADYVGWELCESYYQSLGRHRAPQTDPRFRPDIPGCDISGCAEQDWYYSQKENSTYSSLFVDLRDKFNQCQWVRDNRDPYSILLYPYDEISNVPYIAINRLAKESAHWNNSNDGFKQKLAQYIGVYFTKGEYDSFVMTWNGYFLLHP